MKRIDDNWIAGFRETVFAWMRTLSRDERLSELRTSMRAAMAARDKAAFHQGAEGGGTPAADDCLLAGDEQLAADDRREMEDEFRRISMIEFLIPDASTADARRKLRYSETIRGGDRELDRFLARVEAARQD